MKKIAKLLLLTGVSTVMLCSNAYADDNIVASENAVSIQTEDPQTIISEIVLQNEEETKSGIVNANVLNVRSGPSTNDMILGKLSVGNNVDIVAETGNWYQIKFDSGLAYVSSEFITIGSGDASTVVSASVPVGSEVVKYAKQFVGVPYQYGGVSPSGFDCSGFVKYVMSHFNYTLPHSSSDQYSYGTRIEKSNLMEGDLVFFIHSGSSRISHVGIYTGDGNFIHSPVPGQSVKIDSLTTGYFANCYYGATRVAK